MATKFLSISIADYMIKVAVINRKGKHSHLLSAFSFATPENCVVDGQVMDAEKLSERLLTELTKNDCANIRPTIIVTPSTKVVSREVFLPPVKERRLKAMIATNASEYFPVDLNNYKVSYMILEKVKGEEPGYRVMVTAAPKSLLQSFTNLGQVSGLAVVYIDQAANSQYQVLRELAIPGITMFANISIKQTVISFMQGNMLLFQRSLPFGGYDLIKTAMDIYQVEDNRLLDILASCLNTEWLNAAIPEAERQDIYGRLVSGIMRSADFFKSSRKNQQIEKVVIFGACADLSGLKEQIAAGMRLDVEILANLTLNQKMAADARELSSYISSIGATLNPLDLIPEVVKEKKAADSKKEANKSLAPVILILCILGSGSITALSYMDLNLLRLNLDYTNQRIETLSYAAEVFNQYNLYNNQRANLQALEDLSSNANNAALLAFLEELEVKMPQSVLFLSASCDEVGVSINAQTTSVEAVALAISQLRTFESIGDIAVSTISESSDEFGFTTVSFSLSCYYAVAEEDLEAVAEDSSGDTVTDEVYDAESDSEEGV